MIEKEIKREFTELFILVCIVIGGVNAVALTFILSAIEKTCGGR